jgi:hypothetical protein
MKIIFLDIDGVLNCQDAYKDGFCKYYHDPNDDEFWYQTFYPISKALINRLIVQTNAKIIISSTWRKSGLDFMKRAWENEGMEGEIIDITPCLYFKDNGSVPRGCEIEQWLKHKGFSHINWSKEKQQEYMDKSDIENYIIIDDDSDMLYGQRNHFVHVLPSPRNTSG